MSDYRIGALARERSYSIRGLVECDLPMKVRALYCLYEADYLASSTNSRDLAIPLWLAAAQTFAALSSADTQAAQKEGE